ncbi:AGAP004545-PA-like protein [Anopheles sinensis]|uniref:tRNA (34-2'-O)-methyltransferase regulator WDR6 n=1 Tax=Anopheles sinensis TaxID=74873 RepID=A0A084WTV2_ANOSI|nr:AGAP004545-PA-like protein [Anopheles sinensis]
MATITAAAVGNQLLLVYLTANGDTKQKFAPVPRLKDKIHGIEKCAIEDEKYLIVFHAGREAYTLMLNCATHQFAPECVRIVIPEETCLHPVPHVRRRANDWISSISLLSPSELCIVTCHGVAVCLRRSGGNESLIWKLAEKSACEDGSTLYCSTLVGHRWEEVVCFSGTALGLLLVWYVSGEQHGKVLKSVSAHNGVIFSIACDLGSGLLTTTSDDRSVKFWRLDLKASVSNDVTLREEQYCFAHTARVFQCRIIQNDKRTLVASIGEDAHLCLWNTDGDLLLKKRLDDGPTLWSMDYDVETSTIFITASNGNIHKYCIRRWMEENCLYKTFGQSELFDISPILPPNEHLAKIRFTPLGSTIGVTNKNRVVILDNTGTQIDSLERFENFKCSILEVGECFLYLAGGYQIYLYAITPQGLTFVDTSHVVALISKAKLNEEDENLQNEIIRSLNYCERSKTVSVCYASGQCLVLDEQLTCVISFHRIPKSAERWLTAFRVLNDTLLLMADRSGHLYLFDRKTESPTFKLSNVHGKFGITSITVAEESQEQNSGYVLLTTGHDSRICELFVDSAKKTLTSLNSSKTAISWIDRTVLLRSERFHLGFNDAHFVMVDNRNVVYTQFDCGGGHRCWDYYYDEPSDTFTFAFIQHKKLKKMQYTLQRNAGSALCLPRYDWHTRACNALHVAHRGDSRLVISGGEDNILRINTFVRGELLEEPRKYVFNHISSIKAIVVKEQYEDGRLVIVSAGGRAQICITSLELKSFRVKQECTYMLLESDSERSRWKLNRRSNVDPETKFMCATFIGSERIVFGCSDGFLRVYNINSTNDQWSLEPVCETFYGRCILKVISVVMHGKSLFITMATDGYLCFWDASNTVEPFYRHRLHSSGINSVDFKCVNSDMLQFATGGDDQSLAVSLFKITLVEDKFQVELIHSLCENYLHTAQVTGIKLLDDDKVVSVGIDQRIYVSAFTGYSKLETISSTNTCVADVKGLSYIREDNQIIVYGCGIECSPLEGL